MKIALGTVSIQKKEFLEEVLTELGISADIKTIDVKSGVSNQPVSNRETKQGSLNRARKALRLFPDADFALGIEIGYHPNQQGNYRMFCWTSLVDKNGKRISVRSHQLLLPFFHQQILKENKFLGDYVRQFLIENSDPLSQHIGVIIKDRKPFIQTSVKLVLLNYLVK